MDKNQILFLEQAAATYPFPIASVLKRYLGSKHKDSFAEWEMLSKEVLLPNLLYMSHLLLADLVASGQKPPHLYPKITDILIRPTYGRYINFLRETSRYYRDNKLNCAFPELLDFVLASEVDCILLEGSKALLSELVDYRNQISHGRIGNVEVMDETVAHIRQLTFKLMESLRFLKNYPLVTGDGTSLMGCDMPNSAKESSSFLVISSGERNLRPLLLKLRGDDVLLLEEADIKERRLGYKGSKSFVQFKRKELDKGNGQQIFIELSELLLSVRAITTVLPYPDWDTFKERAALISERTLTNYKEMGKYVPSLFISNPNWTGERNIFQRYLESDRTLLTISGPSGSGKSAQVSKLAAQASEDGHAGLFINAQRFTFASIIEHGVNPFPGYFASILHYENALQKDTFKRLIKSGPPGKQVILFIDAINEIDGLFGKWNRFIAIEKLLEWTSQVAQPGLKIVLSFRVDLYEEFNYLEPEDEFMPENLNDIAYPGNHLRKPWVWELDPFNEGQAEQLYNILQSEPESGKGLAPLMTWQEVKIGLGEAFNKVTTNPLTFMLFLRAHHKETNIINRNPEAIFDEYVARITGSNEISLWPWYKKLWGFVHNGNITPKEQVIADLFNKMSSLGNTAILINRNTFNTKKKKEKRLAHNLNTSNNHALKDLTEGKMLVDETIEYEIGEKLETVRRISFVGELITPTAENIFHKFDKNYKIRSSLLIFIFILSFLGLFSYLSFGFLMSERMIQNYNHLGLLGININFEAYARSYIFVTIFIIINLTLLVSYFFVFDIFRNNIKVKISQVGIPSYGIMRLLQFTFLNNFNKGVLIIAIPALVLSVVQLLTSSETKIFTNITYFLLVFIIILCLQAILLMPYIYQYYGRKNKKLLSVVAYKYKMCYTTKNFSDKPNYRLKIIFSTLLLIHLSTSIYFVKHFTPSIEIPYALSNDELIITYGLAMANMFGDVVVTGGRFLFIFFGFLVLFIILIFNSINSYFTIRAYTRLYEIRTLGINSIKRKITRSWFKAFLLTLILFLILNNRSEIFRSSNKIIQLITEKDYTFPSADSLSTNEILRICNGLGEIPPFKNNNLRELSIISAERIGFIVDIENQFPLLEKINITENGAELLGENFKNPTKNLLVTISPVNKGHNELNSKNGLPYIPHLAWLNNEFSKTILDLPSINLQTQNLSRIKRLFLVAGTFEPDLLTLTDSLVWIRITDHDSVSKDWYNRLSNVISFNLPLLKSLEIQVITEDMKIQLSEAKEIGLVKKIEILKTGCYWGIGREDILKKINEFIEEEKANL